MNKEITLYDVIEHIKQSEILLEQFIESEELDVEDLCQQLNDIAYTIKETFESKSGLGEYKTSYNPNNNTFKCNCMGFWRSKGNCKHVKALREKIKS